MTFIGEGSRTNVRCLDRVALSRANKRSTLTGGSSRGNLMNFGAKHKANRKMEIVAAKNNLSSRFLMSSTSFSISKGNRLSLMSRETTRKVLITR
jgi:hypothetical protein